MKGAGAFLVALACVSIPYPIYLHSVTGHWSLSGKAASAVLIRESISRKVVDDDPRSFEALHYALDEEGVAMRSNYWGEDPSAPRAAAGAPVLGIAASEALANVRIAVGRMLPTILPWSIWPFVLIGLALSAVEFARAGPERVGALFALSGMIVPSVLVCLLLFVEPRHHLYLVPVATVFAAGGISWILSRPRSGSGALRILLPALLGGILLWGSVRQLGHAGEIEAARRTFAEIRRLGVRLGEDLPAGEPIMSWHPAVAWYAHRPWRVLPAERFARVAAYAARRGVSTIVFETQVHGPPPGQDAGVPFWVFRLASMTPETLAAGRFELRKAAQDPLYALYLVEPAAGDAPREPPAGGTPSLR